MTGMRVTEKFLREGAFPPCYTEYSAATHVAMLAQHITRIPTELARGDFDGAGISHHWAMMHAGWLNRSTGQP